MGNRLRSLLFLSLTLVTPFYISACGPTPIADTPHIVSALPPAAAFTLLPNGGLALLEKEQKSLSFQSEANAKMEQVSVSTGRIQKMVASPDGKQLLVLIAQEGLVPAPGTVYEQAQVAILNLASKQIKPVEGAKTANYGSQPQWYPNSQQFVYIDLEERLHRYDLASQTDHLVSELKGLSAPLVSEDGKNTFVTHVQPEFAAGEGLRSYRKPLKQILWINSEEKTQILTPSTNESNSAEFLYPDGSLLVSRFQAGKQTLVKISRENQVSKEFSLPNLYQLSGKPSPDEQNIVLESSSNVSDALTQADKTVLVLKEEKKDKDTTLIRSQGATTFPRLISQTHWLDNNTLLFLKADKIYQYQLSTGQEKLYR